MAVATEIITDGSLLWVPVPIQGAPEPWESGKDYKIGDVVIPRFPTAGQLDTMFQVVGYAGTTGIVEPIFPTTEFARVEDGGLVWRALRADRDPPQLPVHEYFLLSEMVVAQ
jgi:hypothetical protein